MAGRWLMFMLFQFSPRMNLSWPHEAGFTLVPKTFTQLTEVAKVARGGHRQT